LAGKTENWVSVANDINMLAAYLGIRDVLELTQGALQSRYGFKQADVMALFGGSILAGGDVLAEAMHADVARAYVIVGGAGHTTEMLRAKTRSLCPDLEFANDATESEIFSAYLLRTYGLTPNLLEMHSTNCGNNITNLRDLLNEQGIKHDSLILSQDATMQRRMVAGVLKEMPSTTPIAFATYEAHMIVQEGEGLIYEHAPRGMWEPRRYLTLLMGEIPRLTDDDDGYGPKGRGFIVHLDVPDQVKESWERLRKRYPWSVRRADPRYAG
jgi:uncharacterized SAM-binding protein YcdF (DUF218 family)